MVSLKLKLSINNVPSLKTSFDEPIIDQLPNCGDSEGVNGKV